MKRKIAIKYFTNIILVICIISTSLYLNRGIKVQAEVSEKKLYMSFLSKEEKRMREEEYKESEIRTYQLIDINKDEKKELIYTYWNGGARSCGKVCMINNGKVKVLCSVAGQPVFYKIKGSGTKIAVGEAGGASLYFYEIYDFTSSKAKEVCAYDWEISDDGVTKYYKDGKRISKKSFTKFYKKLKEVKMKDYKK